MKCDKIFSQVLCVVKTKLEHCSKAYMSYNVFYVLAHVDDSDTEINSFKKNHTTLTCVIQ